MPLSSMPLKTVFILESVGAFLTQSSSPNAAALFKDRKFKLEK